MAASAGGTTASTPNSLHEADQIVTTLHKPSPGSTGSGAGSATERVKVLNFSDTSSAAHDGSDTRSDAEGERSSDASYGDENEDPQEADRMDVEPPAVIRDAGGPLSDATRRERHGSDDRTDEGSDNSSSPGNDCAARHRPQKRARQKAADAESASEASGGSRDTPSRAQSEPLPSRVNRLSPSPPIKPLPLVSEMTPPPTPESPMTTVGPLPLETFLQVVDYSSEESVLRMSHASRAFRRAILNCPALWSKRITLNVGSMHFLDKLEAYLGRSGVGIRRIELILPGPGVIRGADGRPAWNNDDRYFSTETWTRHNIDKLDPIFRKYHDARGPSIVSARFLGCFQPTFVAADALWGALCRPWTADVIRFSMFVGFARLTLCPFTLPYLARSMSRLQEIHINSEARQDPGRGVRPMTWGPVRVELTDTDRQRFLASKLDYLRKLSFSGVFLYSEFVLLPSGFPSLRHLDFECVSWGRMVFDLLRKSPALQWLRFAAFELVQEPEGELPIDFAGDWEVDDELDESCGALMRPTPIFLNHLRYLELESGAPPIWSVLGEMVQNANVHMPHLVELRCCAIDLETEESALPDLPLFAPNLRDLMVVECAFTEAEMFEAIKLLPHLEALDFRDNDSIDSDFVSCLALAVPHVRRLDVRGCRFVSPIAVARLAETLRDSSDGERRLEAVGLDQPLRPAGVDGPGEGGGWEPWSAWRWLEFTHTLLDQLEWQHSRRHRKDKAPIRPIVEERHPLVVTLGRKQPSATDDQAASSREQDTQGSQAGTNAAGGRNAGASSTVLHNDFLQQIASAASGVTPEMAVTLQGVISHQRNESSGEEPKQTMVEDHSYDIASAASVAAEVAVAAEAADAISIADETPRSVVALGEGSASFHQAQPRPLSIGPS